MLFSLVFAVVTDQCTNSRDTAILSRVIGQLPDPTALYTTQVPWQDTVNCIANREVHCIDISPFMHLMVHNNQLTTIGYYIVGEMGELSINPKLNPDSFYYKDTRLRKRNTERQVACKNIKTKACVGVGVVFIIMSCVAIDQIAEYKGLDKANLFGLIALVLFGGLLAVGSLLFCLSCLFDCFKDISTVCGQNKDVEMGLEVASTSGVGTPSE